jgi:hypothetical protein
MPNSEACRVYDPKNRFVFDHSKSKHSAIASRVRGSANCGRRVLM